MTLYARILARVERWIEANDRERDDLARSSAWDVQTDIERAFVRARLAFLETERVRAVDTLERLRLLENRPEVMFPERPALMLKATLPAPPAERKRA